MVRSVAPHAAAAGTCPLDCVAGTVIISHVPIDASVDASLLGGASHGSAQRASPSSEAARTRR